MHCSDFGFRNRLTTSSGEGVTTRYSSFMHSKSNLVGQSFLSDISEPLS